MASNEYQIPDLASVLQTLSAYVPTSSLQPNNDTSYHENPEQPPEEEYEPPASFQAADQTVREERTNPIPITQPEEAAYSTPANPPVKASVTPDPSTITKWPAALQFVMKTVAQNEAHQAKIRRLIRTQNEHEKQWWDGREALLAKQRARAEKKKTLDDVL